jgi:hypothetical protein
MRRISGTIVGPSKLIEWERSWGGAQWLQERVFKNYNLLFNCTELSFNLMDSTNKSRSPYSLYIQTSNIKNIKVV